MEAQNSRYKRERELDLDSDTSSESGVDAGATTELTTAGDKLQGLEVPHHWEEGVLSFHCSSKVY